MKLKDTFVTQEMDGEQVMVEADGGFAGMVRSNATALGAVEAMQASEVVFAALLGVMFLGEQWPQGQAFFGVLLVVTGIVLFAWVVAHEAARDQREVQALRSERGR